MRLTERDFVVLRLVYRFKFCLGKHIKVLSGFEGTRATDRRLKILIEAGYLTRKKYIYGVPYLYTLTHKGRMLIGANKREDKIRVDRISHDIYVLDTVVYYRLKFDLELADIESEKDLHIKDGFGARKHQPDFVVTMDGNSYAVEVELNNYKTKERLEKNIRDNYTRFDNQVWIIENNKTFALIQSFTNEYANMELIHLKEVLDYVMERYR